MLWTFLDARGQQAQGSIFFKYNDDADDVANDDAGYVADDDGRNRFISTTTVGPRAFKLSSGLPALRCLRLPASHQDHRHNRHFVEIVIKIIIIMIKIIIMIIKIIVKIVILSKSLSGSSS